MKTTSCLVRFETTSFYVVGKLKAFQGRNKRILVEVGKRRVAELFGILKEMAYPAVDTMWYSDGEEVKELVDDDGAAEMEKISRARGIVDLYVLHPVSIPEELCVLPTSEGHVDVNNSKTKDGVPIVVLDEENDENCVPAQEVVSDQEIGESVENVVQVDEGEQSHEGEQVDDEGEQVDEADEDEQGDEGTLCEVNIENQTVRGDVEVDVEVINDGSMSNYSSNSDDPDYVDEDVYGDSVSDDDLVSEHSVHEGDDTDCDDSAMSVSLVDSEEEANVGEEIEIDEGAPTNGRVESVGRKRKAAATGRSQSQAGPSRRGRPRKSDVLPSDSDESETDSLHADAGEEIQIIQ
ncbi:hypothetical protein RIF29_21871 [Crotalaria pallida]|uniref:Uncharacterized protein n=1 Tax=Crotalaria pallida TaxID=3830 RepID=A0AAN9I9V0_CROPI